MPNEPAHLRMAVEKAVALIDRHGADEAIKVALGEQRNARRARSRKRFAFWGAVASRIDGRNGRAETDRPDRRELE